MDYGKFTEDYRRWRWVPRSTNEAFRDAHYAASIEIFAPRKSNWLTAAAHAGIWFLAVIGLLTIAFGVARGLV